MPAPSPRTIPERRASNGREAPPGSPDHLDKCFQPRNGMQLNEAPDPLPPASIASAQPRSMAPAASAIANRLEAPPSTIELFGPRASCAMLMWQAAMFGKYLSIHSGNKSLKAKL